MFRITTLALFCLAFSSLTIADEGEHEHHGHYGSRNYGAVERDYYYERAPRYAPHRHHRDTTAMTSVPIRVWLAAL